MTKSIRWGILGTGTIASVFATALREIPDAELAAVASRSSASAERFGAEFGALSCYSSYQELADDPSVDVVYIATPHPMHAENAMLCLNAGKHVLCEKPFAMNTHEAEEVMALARSKNLFVMEAMWSRFLPAVIEARRIIASGEIGRVHQVQSDFGFVADVGPEHRLLDPALGGGALLDIGIYPLSLSTYFLGPVEAVTAVGELGPTGADLQTAFSMRHSGGGLSSCLCSIRAGTPTEMTIVGELGHVRLESRFLQASRLSVALAGGATRSVELPFIGNGYAHEALEVMRCLRAGLVESPVMPQAETLALMALLDEIRRQIGLVYPADKVG